MTYEQLKVLVAAQGKTLEAWTKDNKLSRQWVYMAWNSKRFYSTPAARSLRSKVFSLMKKQVNKDVFRGVLS